MLVILLAAFVAILSNFATDTDYCTVHRFSDSVGHPGITVTCQSGD